MIANPALILYMVINVLKRKRKHQIIYMNIYTYVLYTVTECLWVWKRISNTCEKIMTSEFSEFQQQQKNPQNSQKKVLKCQNSDIFFRMLRKKITNFWIQIEYF